MNVSFPDVGLPIVIPYFARDTMRPFDLLLASVRELASRARAGVRDPGFQNLYAAMEAGLRNVANGKEILDRLIQQPGDERTQAGLVDALSPVVSADPQYYRHLLGAYQSVQHVSQGGQGSVSVNVGRDHFTAGRDIKQDNSITKKTNRFTALSPGTQFAIILGTAVLLGGGAAGVATAGMLVLSSGNPSAGDCVLYEPPYKEIEKTSCSSSGPYVQRIERVVKDVTSPLFICESDEGYLDPDDSTLYCFE